MSIIDSIRVVVLREASYRSVRNFVIDLRQTSDTSGVAGLHWQVSQSTSLVNIVVEMSTASDTTQEGLYMENGR